MAFAFVTTKEYSLSIQLLMAILEEHSIDSEVIFSKYNTMEVLYLQYASSSGDAQTRRKAQLCLEQDRKAILDKIVDMSPEIVGFSVTTDLYQYWLNIAYMAKERLPELPLVMGGTHPSIEPDRVLGNSCIDAVAIGESETGIAPLYNYLTGRSSNNHIKGIWLKKGAQIVKNELAPLVQNLDQIPTPAWEPFIEADPNIASSYQVLVARGCPFNCSYCHAAPARSLYKGLGPYVRKRSPENVLRELAQAKKRYNLEQVRFVDDVFTLSLKWLKEFLPAYKKDIGLPFTCLIHPNTASEETLRLLANSGCYSIKMGIQHINPIICKEIFNRPLNMPRIRKAISTIKDMGMNLKVDFIIGAPTETEEDLQGFVNLLNEIKIDDIFLYFLKYYPGTQILEYAKQNGVLTPGQIEDAIEGKEFGFQVIPARYQGQQRALYQKYNDLIRAAAGSKFRMEQFNYVLNDS